MKLKRFKFGAEAFFKGFQLQFSGPKVASWSVVPFIINALIFILGLIYGFQTLRLAITNSLHSFSGVWGDIASVTLMALALIILIFGLLAGVFVLSKILTIPFNAMIAKKVLMNRGVLSKDKGKYPSWIRRTLGMIVMAVIQLSFFAVLSVVLFFLSFIPFVSVPIAFVGFLVIAFDCADYAFEYSEISFAKKLNVFAKRLPEFCGFAMAMGLTFFIPVLNFLILPIAVAGASWLVASFDEIW